MDQAGEETFTEVKQRLRAIRQAIIDAPPRPKKREGRPPQYSKRAREEHGVRDYRWKHKRQEAKPCPQ